MRMEDSTMLFLLLAMAQMTRADFEQTCDLENAHPSTDRCLVVLSRFIFKRCIPERADLFQMSGMQSSLFITADEASQLLTNPFGNARRGLPCECCVHRCSLSEFDQYCAPIRRHARRRLRRRATQQPSRYFTEADVTGVYDTISRLNDSEQTNKMPLQQLHKLFQIKAWKEKNIASKQLAKLGLLSGTKKTKAVIDESHEWRESKPKLLPEVNKESQHHAHRHSGRILAPRKHVNSQN